MSLIFLKHLGFSDFLITMGSSFSPAALRNLNTYMCSPVLIFSHQCSNLPSRKDKNRKQPVSSMFQIFSGFQPPVSNLDLCFQFSRASELTMGDKGVETLGNKIDY